MGGCGYSSTTSGAGSYRATRTGRSAVSPSRGPTTSSYGPTRASTAIALSYGATAFRRLAPFATRGRTIRAPPISTIAKGFRRRRFAPTNGSERGTAHHAASHRGDDAAISRRVPAGRAARRGPARADDARGEGRTDDVRLAEEGRDARRRGRRLRPRESAALVRARTWARPGRTPERCRQQRARAGKGTRSACDGRVDERHPAFLRRRKPARHPGCLSRGVPTRPRRRWCDELLPTHRACGHVQPRARRDA